MANQNWHSGPALRDAVERYHDLYARRPNMEQERRIFTSVLTDMRQHFESRRIFNQAKGIQDSLNLWHNVEFTGSTFVGTNVHIEFDVMVILKGGAQFQQPTSSKSFVELRLRQSKPQEPGGVVFGWPHNFDLTGPGNPKVIPQKTRENFKSEIQMFINSSQALNPFRSIKLRDHGVSGPGVQIDISEGNIQFSADLVPTFQIEGQYYIPKPFKNQDSNQYDQSWRRSFALEEKKQLDAADSGNQCKKKIYRVLKVIRSKEPTLSTITSYQLKTVLLKLMKRESDWNRDKIGIRFMDVLKELHECYTRGNLTCKDQGDINLLDGMNEVVRSNIAGRLQRFINSEVEMMKVLQS